jgi:hypothetical protein
MERILPSRVNVRASTHVSARGLHEDPQHFERKGASRSAADLSHRPLLGQFPRDQSALLIVGTLDER